jgi:hypothetical protein
MCMIIFCRISDPTHPYYIDMDDVSLSGDLCQCVSCGNINKTSVDVGIQLPEKYKENFEVSSEGTSS